MSEPAVPRRGRPGHDQAAVLRAAIDLFNRKGYDATSIGDVADELGVTKSAVYHHVPSKEHLLSEALDEALGELEATVSRAASADGSAYERLRAVVRRSVEVLVDHQPAVTLLLRVHGNSEIEKAALKRRRRIDTRLASLVGRAAKEGALRADLDPDLVSRLLFGMVNSLVEWYRPTGPADVEQLADAVTAIAFEGLDREGGLKEDRLALHVEAMALLDALVQHVTDDDLERPTPCAGWTVADLLAHEIGQHLGFAAAVRDGDAPESAYVPVPFSAETWRDSVEAILSAFAGADPDTPVTARELVPEPLSLRVIVDAQLLDVLAHTWDLAKGLGHDFTPPDHLAADLLKMAQAIPDRAYGEGHAFGERLAPEGSDWEQALRLLGREAGWAPGVS